MEVAVGIEPTNKSFAGPGLTTWLRHQKMERETRFELATSTLARWSSTAELLPQTPLTYPFKNGIRLKAILL